MFSLRCGVVLLIALSLGTCSSGHPSLDVVQVYSKEITELRYEIDYRAGAEPYVGDTANGDPIWDFLRNNVSALFGGTKTITIPGDLSAMEKIPAGQASYNQDDVFALVDEYRNTPVFDGNVASIYVIFLDGYFEQDGEVKDTILGVTFGDTGVIAMFKPALESNTFPSQRIRDFTEQSVLIHESGHALGLVNNGLALTSTHHDEKNGAHCTNTGCVMYYLNEGAKDLLDFIRSGDPGIDKVIYGQECLDDATADLP